MALIPWWIRYPNVNDEIMNLDWLLRVSNENTAKISDFINLNTIKYADPILWDITSQYEANTITVDPQTGDAYISTKAVPYGVSLSNTDYWTKIYNYASEMDILREQIAAANEKLSTTASAPRSIGDLVWLNTELYKITAAMIAGDSYVVDSNCVKTTIEAELTAIVNLFNNKIGDLSNLSTTDKTNIVNAINEVIDNTLTEENPSYTGNLHNAVNLDMGSSKVFQGQADAANISNQTLNAPPKTTSTPVIKSELFTAFTEEPYDGRFVTDAHFVTVKAPNSKSKSAAVVAEIFDYNPRHLDTIAIIGSAKAGADWDGVNEQYLGGLWGGWFIASNEGLNVPIIGAEINLLNTYKDAVDANDPYTSNPTDVSYVCGIYPDWSTHTLTRGLSIEGAYNYGKRIGYGTGISVRDYCQRGIFIDTTLKYADPQTENIPVYPIGIVFGAHSFKKMAVFDHNDDKFKFEQRLEGDNRYWVFRRDEENAWIALDDYDNSIVFNDRVRLRKEGTNYTVLYNTDNTHKYVAFDSNINGLLLTDNNIRFYPSGDNVIIANVDSSHNYATVNIATHEILFGDSKNKVKPNGHVSIGSREDIGNSGAVAGLSINADSVLPFCMKKTSATSGTQPGVDVGCLRFERGTNAGTLKLVAYAGTSSTGVTIVDNIGSGNS